MSKQILTEHQKKQVVEAIGQAENNTSGEIRVHIDKKCKGDVLDRAAFIFDTLNMQKTAQRNGVLIYLATEDRQFAILGDAGINQKVPVDFWDSTKDLMISYFKQGNFTEGLSKGILLAGEQLKKHFPHQKDDKNELGDDISFGN